MVCSVKRESACLAREYGMECKKPSNARDCACTYTSCDNRGLCCQCLARHLAAKELPGCCFPPEAERAYDRSFGAFARAWKL